MGKNKLLLLLLLLFPLYVDAQQLQQPVQPRFVRLAYINKYRKLAIRHMKAYHIPASITLAQACLESADGTSKLATVANNHFGIKCHNDWKGKGIAHEGDKGECYRSYKHAEESFKDHSDFLRNKERYAGLFRLETTDYKAWAYGLKKAGYATDPIYAERLIKIIEEYMLYRYDNEAIDSMFWEI